MHLCLVRAPCLPAARPALCLSSLTGSVRQEPGQSGGGRRGRFRHSVGGLGFVPTGQQHRQERHSLPRQFLVFSLSSDPTGVQCLRRELSPLPPLSRVCVCVCFVRRSARSTARAWWCAKATAIGSFTWSVSAWRPSPKAGSPAWNVEMVSDSGGPEVSVVDHLLFGPVTTSAAPLPPPRP